MKYDIPNTLTNRKNPEEGIVWCDTLISGDDLDEQVNKLIEEELKKLIATVQGERK